MRCRLDSKPLALPLAGDIDELLALRRMAIYLADQLAAMSDRSAFAANLLVEAIASDISAAANVALRKLN